jgi:hypothetical protein
MARCSTASGKGEGRFWKPVTLLLLRGTQIIFAPLGSIAAARPPPGATLQCAGIALALCTAWRTWQEAYTRSALVIGTSGADAANGAWPASAPAPHIAATARASSNRMMLLLRFVCYGCHSMLRYRNSDLRPCGDFVGM